LFFCCIIFSFVASREHMLVSNIANGKLEIKVNLRTSTFNVESPLFLGSVGGGFVLIIAIIIIVYKCRRTGGVESPEVLKVQLANQIDLSLDKSKIKLNDNSTKDKDNKIITQIDSGRKLVGTPTEQKQQKISRLLEEFSNKLKEKYSSQHDKGDFFKPYFSNKSIYNPGDSNKKDGLSNISKMTDISNQKIKKSGISDLVCYTNEKRDSPTNSFYEEKLEEMNRIEEMELDEEIKSEKIEDDEDPCEDQVIEEAENVEQNFDDDDDEGLEYIEKEYDKHNLQPDCDDVISDYKEKN